ncbi:MAG TPA: MoaD/ThiS family protein [Methanomicrobiales archaeon]|nr:MoaD/ThiS family protein [Methanomicrobiales archaeon]
MQIQLPEGTSGRFEGGPATVSEVLVSLGINPAAVIVTRGGRVIPDDAVLGEDDVIRVVRVSHGG